MTDHTTRLLEIVKKIESHIDSTHYREEIDLSYLYDLFEEAHEVEAE